MGDGETNGQSHRSRSRSWIRWLLVVLGVTFLVLIVFHAPILRGLIRALAVRSAARENLKLSFQLAGDPLEQITLRHVHATPTGPTAVQALDVGEAKIDYSLPDLLFHGISDVLKNVEVRDVVAVLDSSKAPARTPTPTPAPNQKVSLPAFFPERLEARNVNLTIKQQPQDMVIQNLNLGLYPNQQGGLEIDKVQIPGVHTWTNIRATTTYADKELHIRGLTLDENNGLREVSLNASKIGQGELGLKFEGTLGGGKIAGKTQLSAQGSSYNINAELQARNVSLGQLGQHFDQLTGRVGGELLSLDIGWQGKLDQPTSWNGRISGRLDGLREDRFQLDRAQLDLQAANGQATVREARIDQGNNHLQLRGSIDLPTTMDGFGRTPGSFQFTVEAPDLPQLTAFLTQPAGGSLLANGEIKVENQTVQLDLTSHGELISFQGVALRTVSASVRAAKKMPPPNEKRAVPFYAGVTSSIETELQDVRFGDFAVDRVHAKVTSDGAKISLAPLTAVAENNLLQVTGNLQFPPPNEKLSDQPADLQFNLRAVQLSDFWRSDAPNKVTGQLQGDGQIRMRQGVAGGQINLYGQQIAANRLIVRQADLQVAIAGDTVYLNDLTATLSERDYLTAHGTMKLQKPYRYAGAAIANLADLSIFEPLLQAGETGSTPSHEAKNLAGSLALNWNGEGEAETFANRGDLRLRLEHGRYADLHNLEANIEAHYTPQELNVPIIFIGSDKFNFQAILQAKDSTLEISKIQIDQGQAKYAAAYASIPFTWGNLGSRQPLIPPDGNVQINFQSENLDLAKLFQVLGTKPPASGQVTLRLDAQGPLDRLQANLDLRMQNLEAAAAKNLEPAKIDVAMRLQDNELKVLGKVEQPKIQPVQIDARLPLNLSQVIANRKLDEQTPVQARIQMPRSSINFVREFVPALRQLDGTLVLNVNVDGTVSRPEMSGAGDININMARFENPTLPALTNFAGRLNFRGDTLSIDRFGGDLAGGPFTVSGRITLPKLTEPNFNLRLKANSVLVARNDNLTARVDADIRVEGPMKGATVKGQVLTTNSRFFKNIDIIPIALPGRPAPHPEPPSSAPTLSFPNPPLRDWKFDISIKSKDPFLIRGNLATGKAIIDMQVSGTGLHPGLQGQVRLENFDATLPFSTLSVNLGFLYFDPDDPLNPRIELQGTSLIRDYTIHVYVYGTVNAPQAIFSSEPPLPQEEIISLLATGTTREELATGNVLASRAGMLLFKQLYRKIFKKGAEPEKNDSFFSRLDVEFGNTDPRTGEQTATARYKVNDHVVLIGDIGVQGDFRGLVKYLIRFR